MPSDPSVRRARLPDAYGLPEDSPTLPWESVEARFKASLHYWISTVDAEGNPLARPIDGICLTVPSISAAMTMRDGAAT